MVPFAANPFSEEQIPSFKSRLHFGRGNNKIDRFISAKRASSPFKVVMQLRALSLEATGRKHSPNPYQFPSFFFFSRI